MVWCASCIFLKLKVVFLVYFTLNRKSSSECHTESQINIILIWNSQFCSWKLAEQLPGVDICYKLPYPVALFWEGRVGLARMNAIVKSTTIKFLYCLWGKVPSVLNLLEFFKLLEIKSNAVCTNSDNLFLSNFWEMLSYVLEGQQNRPCTFKLYILLEICPKLKDIQAELFTTVYLFYLLKLIKRHVIKIMGCDCTIFAQFLF